MSPIVIAILACAAIITILALIITSIIMKKRSDASVMSELYNGLCAIGVDARMTERGRMEERVGEKRLRAATSILTRYTAKGKSQGLIEIRDSPIRWVNVVKGEISGADHPHTEFSSVYLVEDPNVCSKRYLTSVPVKSRPIFGRVVDLRWKGNFEADLIRRMNEDVSLNRRLRVLKEDVEINSYPERRCWSISPSCYQHRSVWGGSRWQPTPSRGQWNCYETIARHLLEPGIK